MAGVNDTLRELLPAFAKDVRLTLDSLLSRPAIPENEAYAVALAAASAAENAVLARLLRESGKLTAAEAEAAQTAAMAMAMTNAWYSFVELSRDGELVGEDPGLRMGSYHEQVKINQRLFEMCTLAASIVGRCRSCTSSHCENLRRIGVTTPELREVGRLTAAVAATAKAFKLK